MGLIVVVFVYHFPLVIRPGKTPIIVDGHIGMIFLVAPHPLWLCILAYYSLGVALSIVLATVGLRAYLGMSSTALRGQIGD